MEVSKVFDTEKQIIRYDNLGIARLIYQLPTTLCEAFLREVFKQGSIESLDQETLFTIQRFFENNLNVSETSRGLFVHRNTLVYRLEKIKKLTGLDLREFDDAIVFQGGVDGQEVPVQQPGQILMQPPHRVPCPAPEPAARPRCWPVLFAGRKFLTQKIQKCQEYPSFHDRF